MYYIGLRVKPVDNETREMLYKGKTVPFPEALQPRSYTDLTGTAKEYNFHVHST